MIKIRLKDDNYFDGTSSVLSDLQSYLFAQDNHTPLRGRWIVCEKAGKMLLQSKFIDHFETVEKIDGYIIEMPIDWLNQLDHEVYPTDEEGNVLEEPVLTSNADYFNAVISIDGMSGYVAITPMNFNVLKEHFDVESEYPNIYAGIKRAELIRDYYTEAIEE